MIAVETMSQKSTNTVLWREVYELVLTSGSVHDHKGFSKKLIHALESLVPFDQGRIYFVNENRKVADQYLVGIREEWVNAYHDYYSKIENGRYAVPVDRRAERQQGSWPVIGQREWQFCPKDEFVRDYVASLGLKYSIGFSMSDADNNSRTYFMLDRTTPVPFSNMEVMILNLALPQLNNLHINFFSKESEERRLRRISWETTNLTPREIEVANLLCHGVKPAHISLKLNVTKATTYKHVAHIYEKMRVSSQRELLVKLLNS
jgi:DNA-binding CsgD family transcriptional regulator